MKYKQTLTFVFAWLMVWLNIEICLLISKYCLHYSGSKKLKILTSLAPLNFWNIITRFTVHYSHHWLESWGNWLLYWGLWSTCPPSTVRRILWLTNDLNLVRSWGHRKSVTTFPHFPSIALTRRFSHSTGNVLSGGQRLVIGLTKNLTPIQGNWL